MIEYFVSVWINNKRNIYHNIFAEYMDGKIQEAINRLEKLVLPYQIRKMWMRNILQSAKHQLHELGYFAQDNIFRNKTLKEFIQEHAPEGSFETAEFTRSFLRLANAENRDIDIESVNYVWAMYYNRKDYSVYTIGTALIVFEKYNLIDAMDSLEILKRLMEQSEKGIRHIMASYINDKTCDFTKELVECNYFNSDCPVDIFDLASEHLNCFEKHHIIERLEDLIRYHIRAKEVEYYDIQNILDSKYGQLVLNALDYFNFKVYGPNDNSEAIFLLESNGIDYIIKEDTASIKAHIPFEHGHIHENDRSHIIENDIDYLDIARFTDGWYSCLPYVDLYLLYNQEEVRRDYMKIIHKSMFARVSDREYIGNWHHLIGNIPAFLDQSNIDVDWERLFQIFRKFLKESLIYDGRE